MYFPIRPVLRSSPEYSFIGGGTPTRPNNSIGLGLFTPRASWAQGGGVAVLCACLDTVCTLHLVFSIRICNTCIIKCILVVYIPRWRTRAVRAYRRGDIGRASNSMDAMMTTIRMMDC